MIFCDLNRFVPSQEHPDRIWNKITTKFHKLAAGFTTTCKKDIMAFTESGGPGKFFQIQICPDYLVKVTAARYSSSVIINHVVYPECPYFFTLYLSLRTDRNQCLTGFLVCLPQKWTRMQCSMGQCFTSSSIPCEVGYSTMWNLLMNGQLSWRKPLRKPFAMQVAEP